jgi:competence protein ComEC
VTFLDVGQGDAALVRFPDGRSMVVDAGGGGAFDLGSRVVVPAIWRLGVRRLDYLVLSHGDPDHIGGARSVLGDLQPLSIWEGIAVPGHQPMDALRAEAGRSGATWTSHRAGESLQLGPARLEIVHPPEADWERRRVRNDDSLVIELSMGRVAILLTGDVGKEVEPEIAARLHRKAWRLVKVPHHGSASSSSPGFLEALRPAVAVVSAGRANWYGHPRPEVLERYRRVGAEVFRTDEDGAVDVATNGERVIIRTMRGRTLRLNASSRP